jgi:tetrahydromethanopterin S-methyltransferase subunit F
VSGQFVVAADTRSEKKTVAAYVEEFRSAMDLIGRAD